MNSFYVYRVDVGGHNNVLVCYVASFGFDIVKFGGIIKNAFDGSPFSKDLVVISAEYNRGEILEKLINNSVEIQRLKRSVNNYQQINFHLASVKLDGGVIFDEKLEGPAVGGFRVNSTFSTVLDLGLVDIVTRNNLVLESSPNYHFVKPSGKHTSRFIKASNVMQRSAEISFMALNLLKFVKGKIDKVYTDTAGIFPLAYELVSISRRFSKDKETCEFIDSFGSYKGLDSYAFSGGENTLVLISATTSDDLSNKLKVKVGLSQAKIVAVFSSSISSSYPVLVDFKKFYGVYKNILFAPISSSAEHECDLCIYEKSIPLSLANSQFVFEAPKTELYLPLAKDSDKNIRDLVSNYKDSGVFRCLYDGLNGKTDPVPEYFIDVSSLVLGNAKFQDKVKNFVLRSFPLSASDIIYANDQGAAELAKKIQIEVEALGRQVCVVSVDEMPLVKIPSGIVVVAGSIQTGKSLLGISRKLRSIDNVPITYVVGFAKYNDPASYNKLKRDLAFNNGSSSLGNHQFISIEEIMLPLNECRMSSWAREQDVLGQVRSLARNTKASLKFIRKRENYLRKVTKNDVQGAGEQLFLLSPLGKPMVLGKTFAFWNEEDSRAEFSHQATVYFTISNILQGLRYSKSLRDIAPLKEGYILKQLDPLLFDRFNEGIIQASVLRAAKPKELDYSADDNSSNIVGSLVERMINFPEATTSEALPEFLLALCSGKLQIKKDHIKNLPQLQISSRKYPLAWILLEYAKDLLFKEGVEESIPF